MNYKVYNKKILDDLKLKASLSSRKRAHYNVHSSYDDSVQKVLIFLLNETYIPPHFHNKSHQTELFIVLKGTIKLITFDKIGNVKNVLLLGEGQESSMTEIFPGTIHTVICQSNESILLEIKEGPYIEKDAKEFPSWAILECDSRVNSFVHHLQSLPIDD